MLIKCPDCGRDVSDSAPRCPKCGAPVASLLRKEKVVSSARSAGRGVARFVYVNLVFAMSLVATAGLIATFIWIICVTGRAERFEWEAEYSLRRQFGEQGEPKAHYEKRVAAMQAMAENYPEWNRYSNDVLRRRLERIGVLRGIDLSDIEPSSLRVLGLAPWELHLQKFGTLYAVLLLGFAVITPTFGWKSRVQRLKR